MKREIPVNSEGHYTIGGLDSLELAKKFGTPTIVYDVAKIKEQIAKFKAGFEEENVKYHISYASKAFSSLAMYDLVAKSGIGSDVVSGGELYAALKGGMDPQELEFHGNNKSRAELEMAVDSNVGYIIVDNFYEIDLLNEVLTEKNKTANILLRLAPGIHAETHEYISTGQAKSKFGFDLQSGQASEALEKTLANPRFKVLGVHSHIGSQIFATAGFVETAKKLMDFLSAWKEKYDFTAEVLNLGGGFGIRYTDQDEPLDVKDFVKIIVEAVKEKSKELNYPMPASWIEPGRSVVGEAGVSLYTVGSRKDVEGVGSFVAVDGGMGDNIRPALYGAKYDAVLAKDPNAPIAQNASIVGKFCESGDILIKDYDFPKTEPGDVIAMLSTGAYGYVMASNYNRNPRPAIVFVEDGKARLVVKRESYEDMIRNEIL